MEVTSMFRKVFGTEPPDLFCWNAGSYLKTIRYMDLVHLETQIFPIFLCGLLNICLETQIFPIFHVNY